MGNTDDRKVEIRNLSYDKVIKRYLEDKCTLIQFVNGVFEDNIPIDAEVIWHDKETVDESNTLRVADVYVRIGGRLFGIEFEQGDDTDISIKVFSYSLRGARRHGITSSRDSTTIEFPRVCVIFLRSTANTPRKLKWTYLFPDGQSIEQDVPVIRLEDLSVAEIRRRHLMPVGQFKLRTFEPLNKRNIDEFRATFTELETALTESIADGSMTREAAADMLNNIVDQYNNAVARTDMEVEPIMVTSITETIPWADYLSLFREGRAEGRAEGEAVGKAERDMDIAKAMFRNSDSSPEVVAKNLRAAGISEEVIKEASEYAKTQLPQ